MNSHANVKTFRAPDARSALNAVRAALGGEAVILETREVAGGLFGRAQIEVTAAGPGADAPEVRRAAFEQLPTRGARAASAPGAPAAGPGSAARRGYAPTPAAAAAPGAAELQAEVTALRRVVEELRRKMPKETPRDVARREEILDPDGDADADGGRRLRGPEPEEARRIYRQLVQRGVDEALARGLVEDARRHGGGSRRGDIDELVRAAIRKQLPPAPAPWLAEGRRTVALIGPTGVGKTTAIAKIAARAVLETRFKVALITVDTYRVGASDQLARYGKIMGLPTHVARDTSALTEGVARFRDADLVLIDTAGRSDAESLAAQTAMLRAVPRVEVQLVLSAATGARELSAAVRRYRAAAPDRLIFSKVDEADGPGAVFSVTAGWPTPIPCSCITDGQRVPEDIHPVTGPDIVRLVLGS
jgi:flagellar biosynthesis protein FlhF